MGFLITKLIFEICAIGIIIYCLIRLWKEYRYCKTSCGLHSSLDVQIEMVKKRDAISYYHYRNACNKGIVMVSDVEYAYLLDMNIMMKDIYYCRYVTEKGKVGDDIKVGSCSLWYEGKPVFSDGIYEYLMDDLKKKHVFITAEEMSESVHDGLTRWLTEIEEEEMDN